MCSWCSSETKNTKIPKIKKILRFPYKIPIFMHFDRVLLNFLLHLRRSRKFFLVLGIFTRPRVVLAKVTDEVLALGPQFSQTYYLVFGFSFSHKLCSSEHMFSQMTRMSSRFCHVHTSVGSRPNTYFSPILFSSDLTYSSKLCVRFSVLAKASDNPRIFFPRMVLAKTNTIQN